MTSPRLGVLLPMLATLSASLAAPQESADDPEIFFNIYEFLAGSILILLLLTALALGAVLFLRRMWQWVDVRSKK